MADEVPKEEKSAKKSAQSDNKVEVVLDYEALKHLDIAKDQLKMLKQIFDSFDLEKVGEIGVDMIGQILDMLGHQLSPDELSKIIKEIDEDGNGVMSFEEFAHLAARFLVEEEEDVEAILRELKDAFRLYDREGLGYITVDLLRDILKELDDKLTPSDLNEMIKEIDTDNSGTVDWEEFKAMMIG
ncbi:troponin C, isoallergen Bla g 6.0101-like isoform X1 [Anthonomus grandis grandis]|uniref:troponin C, isoallergen Bla g 6.0101-like isoform X1 n=1 Tax=Anthonomus grandis grandis TaxID=2921223 RepID=UPI00216606BD|nr:troponin C, isoallergen Bla g 6.0101-like isoform X1 [Anthonomus grandis grandis]